MDPGACQQGRVLDGQLEEMRDWLLTCAGINTAVIERLMATLDEEEVDSLDDLRLLAGRAGGKFDTRLTVTTAGKIRDALLETTPPMRRRGAPPTPPPQPEPLPEPPLPESADDAAQDEPTQALPSPPPAPPTASTLFDLRGWSHGYLQPPDARVYAELQSKHRAAYGDDEAAREAAGKAALLRAKDSLSTGWAARLCCEQRGRLAAARLPQLRGVRQRVLAVESARECAPERATRERSRFQSASVCVCGHSRARGACSRPRTNATVIVECLLAKREPLKKTMTDYGSR